MKALLLSEIFPPTHGGSGRWFWEMYSRFNTDDFVFAVGQHLNQADFDKSHNLNIHRINLSSSEWGIKSLIGLKYYWRTFKAVRKMVREEKVNQIHCGRCLPEGVIAYLIHFFYKIPYLCYVHGEDIEEASLSRELSWMVNKVLDSASVLIANSENTRSLLTEKWRVDAEKTRLLNPGVDCKKFKPAEQNVFSKFREQWADQAVILTVGRLQKRKGHDMLIKAMSIILERIPNALYIIIGGGPEEQALIKLVDELDLNENVKFLSEINDSEMIECYQQCDLFVLPNRQVGNDIEGFGMVLVEAQACGKPVIAGDSGGTAETMNIGETGLIIDCTQVEPIANAVCELLSDNNKLKEMGLNATNHIAQKLDWPVIAAKAKNIFAEIKS